MFFSGETITRLINEQSMKMTDAAKQAGVLWGEMTEEAKQPFVKKHDEDVQR